MSKQIPVRQRPTGRAVAEAIRTIGIRSKADARPKRCGDFCAQCFAHVAVVDDSRFDIYDGRHRTRRVRGRSVATHCRSDELTEQVLRCKTRPVPPGRSGGKELLKESRGSGQDVRPGTPTGTHENGPRPGVELPTNSM